MKGDVEVMSVIGGPVWSKLNFDQLRGARYVLRSLRSSPRLGKAAVELVDQLLVESKAAMDKCCTTVEVKNVKGKGRSP